MQHKVMKKQIIHCELVSSKTYSFVLLCTQFSCLHFSWPTSFNSNKFPSSETSVYSEANMIDWNALPVEGSYLHKR